MKIDEEKLKKENPIINNILTDRYEQDYDYVEECLLEHNYENAEYVLEKVNAVREFFGSKKLDIKDLKKELILEHLK